jgi:hypothetical protein
LYRGLPLHPDDEDDPYVFRLDLSELGMSSARVVFGRDAASGAAAIHAEADLGGLSLIRRREDAYVSRRGDQTGAASSTIREGRGVSGGPATEGGN